MRFTLSLSFTIILIFVDLVPATCSGNLFGLVQSEHSQRWLENAIESMKEVQHYVATTEPKLPYHGLDVNELSHDFEAKAAGKGLKDRDPIYAGFDWKEYRRRMLYSLVKDFAPTQPDGRPREPSRMGPEKMFDLRKSRFDFLIEHSTEFKERLKEEGEVVLDPLINSEGNAFLFFHWGANGLERGLKNHPLFSEVDGKRLWATKDEALPVILPWKSAWVLGLNRFWPPPAEPKVAEPPSLPDQVKGDWGGVQRLIKVESGSR